MSVIFMNITENSVQTWVKSFTAGNGKDHNGNDDDTHDARYEKIKTK